MVNVLILLLSASDVIFFLASSLKLTTIVALMNKGYWMAGCCDSFPRLFGHNGVCWDCLMRIRNKGPNGETLKVKLRYYMGLLTV